MSRKAHEHPLLENHPADLAVTAVIGLLAITMCVLVAVPSTRDNVQHADDRFLRWVVAHRVGWVTAMAKVLDVLGSARVTLPVRILAAISLAFRRRWWHVAAFMSAIVLSEIVTDTLKATYDRTRPLGS